MVYTTKFAKNKIEILEALIYSCCQGGQMCVSAFTYLQNTHVPSPSRLHIRVFWFPDILQGSSSCPEELGVRWLWVVLWLHEGTHCRDLK